MTAPTPFRIGHGFDLHRIQSGGELVVGGVVVSKEMSAVAHSDGDVVIHALVDALLGATGNGDIGEMFPNTDARWKDASSRVFLEAVSKIFTEQGWKLANADITILAERPRLKVFKPAMRAAMAEAMGVDTDRINIKAGTNEEVDAIGRGEAIAAHAVVLLYPAQGR